MEKIICIIDNDFYLTLPVIKALVRYRLTAMQDSTDTILFLFFHILPTADEKDEDREAVKRDKKRFDKEMEKILKSPNKVEAEYYPVPIKLGEPRDNNIEAETIITSIKETIRKVKNWDVYQESYENHILFLLDLALEFRTSDPSGIEDRRTWIATGIYQKLRGKKVILYSSFSDEREMWEKFRKHYKDAYAEDIPDGINPMSRAGLNPRTFDFRYGKEIFEWDGTI